MHEVGNRAYEVPHLINEAADVAGEVPDLADEVRDLVFEGDRRAMGGNIAEEAAS